MKTERWGIGGAVEIQGLTASKSLPQLTQDEFILGGWYAEHRLETDAGSGRRPSQFKCSIVAGLFLPLWGCWLLGDRQKVAESQCLLMAGGFTFGSFSFSQDRFKQA
jgi:hypothetical protein